MYSQNWVDLVRVNGATLHDYAYDRLGDVTLKNEAGTNNAPVYSNARPVHPPKTVNGGTYGYDPNGNLASRPGQTLAYDGLNHLAQVIQGTTTAVYRYDGDGHLAQRTETALAGSTATDFVGERFEENFATNQATKRYFLGDRLVATRVGASLSYLYGDYLRSTAAATGGATAEYAPYGLVRASAGTLPTDRKFDGEQLHAATGLYRMGERWYDLAVGVWTQPDTVVPDPANPQDLNRYAFARGNPLRYRDPTGHTVGDTDCDDCGGAGSSAQASAAPPDVPEGAQPCSWFAGAFCMPTGERTVRVYLSTPDGIVTVDVAGPPDLVPPSFDRRTDEAAEGSGGSGPSQVDETAAGPVGNPAAEGAPVAESSTPGRTFVSTPDGQVIVIPKDWDMRVADDGKGLVFQRKGASGNADMIRVADPHTKNPHGYVRYYNAQGQPLDVNGKPGSNPATHIPWDYQGSLPGWPG